MVLGPDPPVVRQVESGGPHFLLGLFAVGDIAAGIEQRAAANRDLLDVNEHVAGLAGFRRDFALDVPDFLP
jgi:hypothetical protein